VLQKRLGQSQKCGPDRDRLMVRMGTGANDPKSPHYSPYHLIRDPKPNPKNKGLRLHGLRRTPNHRTGDAAVQHRQPFSRRSRVPGSYREVDPSPNPESKCNWLHSLTPSSGAGGKPRGIPEPGSVSCENEKLTPTPI
jgi:hypothetical protein